MAIRELGRRTPEDFDHVEKYPYSVVKSADAVVVEKTLALPSWHLTHDQGFEGCHDEKTEILTSSGWKLWADCHGDEQLGTISPSSGALEFQEPSSWHTYSYKGKIFRVDHKSLDFAITPNHRMWMRPWDERQRSLTNDFSFGEIQDIGWYSGLPASPSGYSGVRLDELTVGARKYLGDDFLALVALVASDGWVGGTENTKPYISFCCFRPDRYEKVAALAQRLGVSEQPSRKGVWKFRDEALAEWLRANLFTAYKFTSPHKRIPGLFKSVHRDQIKSFLEFYGDQHITKSNRRSFYTSSPQMADDLQELLMRVGKRSGFYKRPARDTQMLDGRKILATNCHDEIVVNEWTKNTLSIERKRQLETDIYDGNVFCATVPNGLLITRRSGTVLISGNSCVGHAAAMERAITNSTQNRLLRMFRGGRRYDPLYIWDEAKKIDEWPDTNPGDSHGTSVRAAYDMLRDIGPRRIKGNGIGIDPVSGRPAITQVPVPADAKDGVEANRWATTVDEIRTAIAGGAPVVIGVNWYSSFDTPTQNKYEFWIQHSASGLGRLRGGHAVCLYGASDRREAFKLKNSWGRDYPLTWFPYSIMERLLHEDGEAALTTDR